MTVASTKVLGTSWTVLVAYFAASRCLDKERENVMDLVLVLKGRTRCYLVQRCLKIIDINDI